MKVKFGGSVINFGSLQSHIQQFGMNRALKYLEKDPNKYS